MCVFFVIFVNYIKCYRSSTKTAPQKGQSEVKRPFGIIKKWPTAVGKHIKKSNIGKSVAFCFVVMAQ